MGGASDDRWPEREGPEGSIPVVDGSRFLEVPSEDDATSEEFCNYREEREPWTGRTIRQPLCIGEIAARLHELAPGWPKRWGKRWGKKSLLFVPAEDREPWFLGSRDQLFAWIDGLARVTWLRGHQYISQDRLYEHLRMTAERCDDPLQYCRVDAKGITPRPDTH
jgi:hypothetical protein